VEEKKRSYTGDHIACLGESTGHGRGAREWQDGVVSAGSGCWYSTSRRAASVARSAAETETDERIQCGVCCFIASSGMHEKGRRGDRMERRERDSSKGLQSGTVNNLTIDQLGLPPEPPM